MYVRVNVRARVLYVVKPMLRQSFRVNGSTVFAVVESLFGFVFLVSRLSLRLLHLLRRHSQKTFQHLRSDLFRV